MEGKVVLNIVVLQVLSSRGFSKQACKTNILPISLEKFVTWQKLYNAYANNYWTNKL